MFHMLCILAYYSNKFFDWTDVSQFCFEKYNWSNRILMNTQLNQIFIPCTLTIWYNNYTVAIKYVQWDNILARTRTRCNWSFPPVQLTKLVRTLSELNQRPIEGVERAHNSFSEIETLQSWLSYHRTEARVRPYPFWHKLGKIKTSAILCRLAVFEDYR